MEQAMTPAAQDPRLGMVLQERYRILRKLGDGGMGAVYEGEHIVIKRRVAIKVLHSQFAQNPEIVARFHREAEAATSIGHPNIVEVTDMGRFPDGTAYMVLEFLDGRDWSDDISKQGPQPLGKVVHILSQVCDALDAAHAKGIVHRDLKPENIYLIERRGDPCFAKVLDFGISKIADSQAENRSLTQTGTALGTPYYMAPEQCQGKKDVDPRADIYSLGVIFFQALTAQYPFDDESYPMLVLKICTEPAPSLANYRPDLPPELQNVVNRMLAKNRDHRPSSCAEVKAVLAPYMHMNAAPVVTANAPSTAASGPSVLQAPAAGPVLTPTGTAFLPGTSGPGSTPYPTQQKSSGTGLLIAMVGAIGLLLVAGAIFGVFMAFRDSTPAGHAENTTTQTPGDEGTPPVGNPPAAGSTEGSGEVPTVPDVPPEQQAAGGQEQPTPAMVHVTLTAEPANASIVFDDVPYSNPLDMDVERGPHHLVVHADGYAPVDRNPRYIMDHTETIALQRQRSGRAGGVGRSTSTVGQVHTVDGPTPVERGGGTGIFGQTPPPPPPPPPRGNTLVGGRDIFGARTPAH